MVTVGDTVGATVGVTGCDASVGAEIGTLASPDHPESHTYPTSAATTTRATATTAPASIPIFLK